MLAPSSLTPTCKSTTEQQRSPLQRQQSAGKRRAQKTGPRPLNVDEGVPPMARRAEPQQSFESVLAGLTKANDAVGEAASEAPASADRKSDVSMNLRSVGQLREEVARLNPEELAMLREALCVPDVEALLISSLAPHTRSPRAHVNNKPQCVAKALNSVDASADHLLQMRPHVTVRGAKQRLESRQLEQEADELVGGGRGRGGSRGSGRGGWVDGGGLDIVPGPIDRARPGSPRLLFCQSQGESAGQQTATDSTLVAHVPASAWVRSEIAGVTGTRSATIEQRPIDNAQPATEPQRLQQARDRVLDVAEQTETAAAAVRLNTEQAKAQAEAEIVSLSQQLQQQKQPAEAARRLTFEEEATVPSSRTAAEVEISTMLANAVKEAERVRVDTEVARIAAEDNASKLTARTVAETQRLQQDRDRVLNATEQAETAAAAVRLEIEQAKVQAEAESERLQQEKQQAEAAIEAARRLTFEEEAKAASWLAMAVERQRETEEAESAADAARRQAELDTTAAGQLKTEAVAQRKAAEAEVVTMMACAREAAAKITAEAEVARVQGLDRLTQMEQERQEAFVAAEAHAAAVLDKAKIEAARVVAEAESARALAAEEEAARKSEAAQAAFTAEQEQQGARAAAEAQAASILAQAQAEAARLAGEAEVARRERSSEEADGLAKFTQAQEEARLVAEKVCPRSICVHVALYIMRLL